MPITYTDDKGVTRRWKPQANPSPIESNPSRFGEPRQGQTAQQLQQSEEARQQRVVANYAKNVLPNLPNSAFHEPEQPRPDGYPILPPIAGQQGQPVMPMQAQPQGVPQMQPGQQGMPSVGGIVPTPSTQQKMYLDVWTRNLGLRTDQIKAANDQQGAKELLTAYGDMSYFGFSPEITAQMRELQKRGLSQGGFAVRAADEIRNLIKIGRTAAQTAITTNEQRKYDEGQAAAKEAKAEKIAAQKEAKAEKADDAKVRLDRLQKKLDWAQTDYEAAQKNFDDNNEKSDPLPKEDPIRIRLKKASAKRDNARDMLSAAWDMDQQERSDSGTTTNNFGNNSSGFGGLTGLDQTPPLETNTSTGFGGLGGLPAQPTTQPAPAQPTTQPAASQPPQKFATFVAKLKAGKTLGDMEDELRAMPKADAIALRDYLVDIGYLVRGAPSSPEKPQYLPHGMTMRSKVTSRGTR